MPTYLNIYRIYSQGNEKEKKVYYTFNRYVGASIYQIGDK